MKNLFKLVSSGLLLIASSGIQADILHLDDVIITFSECVGNDCVDGENFGFDTERLKENNLRVHFDDTSTSASFPANDWRIIINDSSNGGANYFGIEDSTAGRRPFTIEAGAPVNTLYVEADGDVGIKTANPVVDLHIVEGNTPTVRLEQDGSDGFSPQTWDMAGNESNFFIRDVTNGSSLFFRAKPGAPANSVYIAADGDIGMRTDSPSASLHVTRSDKTAQLKVTDTSGTIGNLNLVQLENAGGAQVGFNDTTRPYQWNFIGGRDFKINATTFADTEFVMTPQGNLTILGVLSENSDVNAKEKIVPIDRQDVLSKIASLPIAEWSYIDTPQERHIGPMAQDFHATFGLGHNDTLIATLDTAGVALAGIQALLEEYNLLKMENTALLEMLESQAVRLEQQAVRLEQVEVQQVMLQSVIAELYEDKAARTLTSNTISN